VDENDAARFISQFMRTYPGIRKFLDQCVLKCRANGYVETIGGRRRFLPHINSPRADLKGKIWLLVKYARRNFLVV